MAMKTQARLDLRSIHPEDWLDFINKGGTLSDALDIEEDQLEAIYTLAYQKYQNASYQQAHTLFQLLCNCDHTQAKYLLALGATRQALGQHELAGETYSMGIIAHPADPRFFFHAAQCQLALENWRAAGSGFQACVIRCEDSKQHMHLHKQAQDHLRQLAVKLQISDLTQANET